MRVNNVQRTNAVPHKALHVCCENLYRYNKKDVSLCQRKLADTKFVDVIIDSQGLLAIKEKMTDVLQRIQSFSLLPQENAVAFNAIGEKTPKFKFFYSTKEEAKDVWTSLNKKTRGSSLDMYTNTALWLDGELSKLNKR